MHLFLDVNASDPEHRYLLSMPAALLWCATPAQRDSRHDAL